MDLLKLSKLNKNKLNKNKLNKIMIRKRNCRNYKPIIKNWDYRKNNYKKEIGKLFKK
jgi:hypothetical protein